MTEASRDRPPERRLVLICVEDHPKAMALLRIGRSRAQERGVSWCAAFVETPARLERMSEGAQERMLRLLTSAEQMGGETAYIEAETLEKGISQLFEAERGNIVLFLLGRFSEAYLSWHWRPAAWQRLLQLARDWAVPAEAVPLAGQPYRRSLREWLRGFRLRHIPHALGAVSAAYLCGRLLERLLPPALFRINNQNIALLFMIACAFVAGRYGLLPGLVASAGSFLAINYLFTWHHLNLASVTDLLNMGLFLSAALLISLFTSQTRGFAEKAAKRELSTQALFTLYRIAAVATSRGAALERLQEKLTRMLEMDVAFFLPPALNPEAIEPAYPAGLTLDAAELKALELCWNELKTTGLASSFNPSSKWRFEPMLSAGGGVGVLGIRPRPHTRLDAWFGRLLTAIADQTAGGIEHIELERSMEATRISEEREKLRSMLLSSVSHDLKTPLASIVGALGIYRSLGERLSAEKREELIATALQETERLDSFITNILSMTHLESGTIAFRPEWHHAETLVQEVIKRLGHRLHGHRLAVEPCPNAEIYMDLVMTEQVLQNVLDNACKYTAQGSLIEVRCSEGADEGFCWQVRDHGAGLPSENLERIFDKYARLQRKDSQVAGTGLGLAICRAIMTAQKGTITAGNHPEGGAVFTLWLPQWRRVESSQRLSG